MKAGADGPCWTDAEIAEACGCRTKIVESISPMNVSARHLKNGMTNRKIQGGVIPPEADGEFVAPMEDVLETYADFYNKCYPVIRMDEQAVQLLKETR